MVDRNIDSIQETDVFLMPEEGNLNIRKFQNEENMDIFINESMNAGDLNIKECQKSETIDFES